MYTKVIIKISGEALSNGIDPICFDTVDKTAAVIKEAHLAGVKLGLVVGGGNVVRGRNAKAQNRNRMDQMGMPATAINSLALQDSLLRMGVPCRVFSAVAMNRFCDEYSSRAANAAVDSGEVVIFACGTGSPFFSTDTAAALRACEIGAQAMLLAKNIDAVYSADPKLDPNAIRYSHLSYDEVIERGLRATDLTAITMCREQSIPIMLFALERLCDVVSGKDCGTLID